VNTLADIVRRNARLYPGRAAIVDGSTVRSHLDLHSRACGLAHGIGALGLERQDRVAVLSRNRAEFLELYAACELGAFILVGLNWRLALPELARILSDCGARVLFHEAPFAEAAAQLRAQSGDALITISIDDDESSRKGEFDRLAETKGDDDWSARPDDIAYLVYTSGTTGLPKGVMLDHRGQSVAAASMALETGAQPDDRLLVVMPLFHIGARCKTLAYAYRGATLVLHRGFDPRGVLDALAAQQITALHLAPTMVQALVNEQERHAARIDSVRAIHYAAAPMPLPLLRRAIKTFGPVFSQFYGSTESGPVGTVLHRHDHQPDGNDGQRARLASAGQPGIDSDIRIVAEDGHDCATGEVGEVLIKSVALMRGYWNNAEATAAALEDGWLRTGDMGYLDTNCFLFLVDRKKDMIVTGGENVYPREVEDALLQHADVASAAVVGIPDEKWGEAVLAFVVLKPGARLGERTLIEHTRSLIASYKKPKAVRFVEALPLLATGKVDKKALRTPFWANQTRAV
jgi:acyl-CoA synthetase (AMP-forming)/AMP-acid ligase II